MNCIETTRSTKAHDDTVHSQSNWRFSDVLMDVYNVSQTVAMSTALVSLLMWLMLLTAVADACFGHCSRAAGGCPELTPSGKLKLTRNMGQSPT